MIIPMSVGYILSKETIISSISCCYLMFEILKDFFFGQNMCLYDVKTLTLASTSIEKKTE